MPFQQLCNAGLPIPAPREIFVKLGLRSLSHCHSKLIFDGGFDAQAETKAGVRRDRLSPTTAPHNGVLPSVSEVSYTLFPGESRECAGRYPAAA